MEKVGPPSRRPGPGPGPGQKREVKRPVISKEEMRTMSIKLLEAMPEDCDPYEYVEKMKKDLIRNTVEDATMRRLMKNQLSFFTFRHQLEKVLKIPSLEATHVRKKDGQRQKSASAPSSPLKVQEDEGDKPPSKKARMEEDFVITSVAGIGMPKIECTYVHLLATFEYLKEKQIIEKGKAGTWDGTTEPYQIIRTLTRKAVEVMDVLSPNLEDKYWKVAADAASFAGRIFDIYSTNEKLQIMFDMLDTGMQCMLEKGVILLMGEDSEDALFGNQRKDLLMQVTNSVKSIDVRHFLLEKLLAVLNIVLKRIDEALAAATIISFADVNSTFNMFQVVEFILATTSQEPWIDVTLWQNLRKIEDRVTKNLQLAHVLIMLCRQMMLAKPLIKFPQGWYSDEDSDIEVDDAGAGK